MASHFPRIGISLGDPGGIGPEVILKALSSPRPFQEACFIIYAPASLLLKECESVPGCPEPRPLPEGRITGPGVYYQSIRESDAVLSGGPSKENGTVSFGSFQAALEDVLAQRTDALVTAPISKQSWQLAGIKWAGHTHYLQNLYPDAMMTFWSRNLKVALFTHHLPLKEALRKVSRDALFQFIVLLNKHLDGLAFGKRRILVAGLNPHAGEEGLLGTEEQSAIAPAVKEARSMGIPVEGPYPPDTVFLMAKGIPDAFVLGLYHDQGLIAFKWDAFEKGVNATLGMPFLRTSPDHGTAFDIAGKGQANPSSMIEALRLALQFVRAGSGAGKKNEANG